jgi:hypothetical protein
MYFQNLYQFLKFQNRKKKTKKGWTARGLAYWPGPAAKTTQVLVLRMHSARSPRAERRCRRDGGSGDEVLRLRRGEHEWSTRSAMGNF